MHSKCKLSSLNLQLTRREHRRCLTSCAVSVSRRKVQVHIISPCITSKRVGSRHLRFAISTCPPKKARHAQHLPIGQKAQHIVTFRMERAPPSTCAMSLLFLRVYFPLNPSPPSLPLFSFLISAFCISLFILFLSPLALTYTYKTPFFDPLPLFRSDCVTYRQSVKLLRGRQQGPLTRPDIPSHVVPSPDLDRLGRQADHGSNLTSPQGYGQSKYQV